MKIVELLSESQLDEFIGSSPTSGLGAIGTWAGAKLGFKKSQAAQDVNKSADKIYQQFQQWALRSRKDMNNMAPATLQSWLTANGYPDVTAGLGVAPINLNNRAEAADLFRTIAAKSFEAGGLSGQQQQSPAAQPSQNQQQSVNSLITALGATQLTPNQIARLQNIISGTP